MAGHLSRVLGSPRDVDEIGRVTRDVLGGSPRPRPRPPTVSLKKLLSNNRLLRMVKLISGLRDRDSSPGDTLLLTLGPRLDRTGQRGISATIGVLHLLSLLPLVGRAKVLNGLL